MEQRLNFVSLAVQDVAAAGRFYVDGLGWSPAMDVPGEVLMIQVGPQLVLSLWDAAAFAEEVGQPNLGGVPPFTLAHNVSSPAEVDEVLATAQAAGATILTPGTARDWGGYSGYFADPDGFRWEVAHNPHPIGTLTLP